MESIAKALQTFQTYLHHQRRYSEHTCRAYINDMTQSITYFAKQHASPPFSTVQQWAGLTTSEYRSYLAHRIHRKCSHRSNARLIATWRHFSYFLQTHYALPCEGVQRLNTPKTDSLLPKDLAIEYIEALHQQCLKEKISWIGHRNWAIFSMMYGLGLRISEALSIQYTHWPKDNPFITQNITQGYQLKIQGKGGKDRYVPLLSLVYDYVTLYQRSCPWETTSTLFVNHKGQPCQSWEVQQVFRRYRASLGHPHITPHSLRHSFASHLLNSGMDIREIQTLLGHASLNSTQIYTAISQKKILSVYEKSHPFMKRCPS